MSVSGKAQELMTEATPLVGEIHQPTLLQPGFLKKKRLHHRRDLDLVGGPDLASDLGGQNRGNSAADLGSKFAIRDLLDHVGKALGERVTDALHILVQHDTKASLCCFRLRHDPGEVVRAGRSPKSIE
jgi:hypothetical protein